MSRKRSFRQKLKTFGSNIGSTENEFVKGVVTDVITDNEHPLVEDGTIPFGRIGYIRFVPMGALFMSADNGFFAAPFDKNQNTLPLKNERVDILKTTSGYVYRRGNGNISPNTDGVGDTFPKIYRTFKDDDSANSSEYQSTSNTGISNKSDSGNDESAGFGENFEAQTDLIHTLKLFEGDTIIQSRFGQSIRMSGYNNAEEKLHPSIIIRNKENDISQTNLELGEQTEEDVNRDGSIISMTSGEFKLNFQPGIIDDGGSSNFKEKPESFDNYPSELTGDQILINSGRIIISAKESEMIFYSKGNYGFVSDGALSIDNKGGMIVNVDDDVDYITNGSDYNITTETGEIHLGNGDSEEPLVLGDTLVELLKELCTELQKMNHPTPAGPSGPPVNAPAFAGIAAKLQTILSKKNFVD